MICGIHRVYDLSFTALMRWMGSHVDVGGQMTTALVCRRSRFVHSFSVSAGIASPVVSDTAALTLAAAI